MVLGNFLLPVTYLGTYMGTDTLIVVARIDNKGYGLFSKRWKGRIACT